MPLLEYRHTEVNCNIQNRRTYIFSYFSKCSSLAPGAYAKKLLYGINFWVIWLKIKVTVEDINVLQTTLVCFSVAYLQGYYYDADQKHIVLHVHPGKTSSVLEDIEQKYPGADFLSDLQFVEKPSDEKLQKGCLSNGCRIEADCPYDGKRWMGTIAGVFQDEKQQLYVITALHVLTVNVLSVPYIFACI